MKILLTRQDMRVKFLFFRGIKSDFLEKSHDKSRKNPGYSATGSKVYAARFRRAKRLQLERQVMFEILDGGRIHRQVRGKLLNVLLSGNDRSSLGNPSQRSRTFWRTVKIDGGEAELTSES